jgi:hypothetical protein
MIIFCRNDPVMKKITGSIKNCVEFRNIPKNINSIQKQPQITAKKWDIKKFTRK